MRFFRRGAAFGCLALLAAGAHAEFAISGIDKKVEEVVRAFLTVDDLSCDSPRWWVNRAWQRVVPEARLALETLGYYRPSIEPTLTWGEACWEASLAIDLGKPARFAAIDIVVEGPLADEGELHDLLAKRPLRSGNRFTHERYEAAKTRLLDVAEDLGYFDAAFTRSEVRVDPATNHADVALTLAGGERYRIGDIEIEQEELRPDVFQRLLRVESGQAFDAHDLAATYRDLLGSQYFDRVLVTPDVDARADGAVPVRISATAASRRNILLGAGYATDTGPRARADLRYRRLNDRGHRGTVTTLVSGTEGAANADYRIPYGDAANEWLFLQGGLNYEETDTYDNRSWTLGGGRTHARWTHWTETNYVNYRVDDFEVAGDSGHSQLMLFGSSWSRKTLSEDPRPLSGYALSLDVRGATQILLSDTDVVQAIGRARHIFPLGKRVRVLSRAATGWTWQQKFDELPPFLRFFAGGDNSVRGYDYESIGPEKDGEVVGGRRLITGSLELDVLIRDRWSAALFADAGSAFDDSPDFYRGVGFGVRWYSPLGPLRLDFAHPLDDVERAFRIHVSLGPDL